MSSIGVFYGIRSSLFFWQQGNFIFVGKRYTNFTNIQRTSYFISMYFLKNIIFHFPSVEKYHIFREKKCLISSWYRKDHTPVQFFWKDHLLRTFEEYIIFPCFFVFLLSFFLRNFSWSYETYYHLSETFGKRKYGFSCSVVCVPSNYIQVQTTLFHHTKNKSKISL